MQMTWTEGDGDAIRRADGNSLASETCRHIHYNYQPIVCISSGRSFGFEALASGYQSLGFPTMEALFDVAHRLGVLDRIEIMLREQAVATVAATLRRTQARLFFNTDKRTLTLASNMAQQTSEILAVHGLDAASLCLEISERHATSEAVQALDALRSHRLHTHLLVLDEFGSGSSGLQWLYQYRPDFLKIDRFFIQGVCQDERKRLFVGTMVNLAHILGVTVIAEGVETESEFRVCKQVGCDLVQGSYIADPGSDLAMLQETYSIVEETNRRERRDRCGDQRLMRDELIKMPTLSLADSMPMVFETFRSNINCGFFPVLDGRGYPIGVVREVDIKPYIYSPFGKELLKNKVSGRNLRHFISSATTCDVRTNAEMILAMYAQAAEPAPILVTENFRYIGVLRPESLLKVINEKNLQHARDQNPLTRLPGNNPISDYLSEMLDDQDCCYSLIYFDLDHFKPFNDTLGFRQGDRAILMFAEIMRTTLNLPNAFLGHIGGDDFFAGLRDMAPDRVVDLVLDMQSAFRTSIESFYDAETRARGHIVAENREGVRVTYPLLSCSAALIEIPAGPRSASLDQIVSAIADIKKAAKASVNHICRHRLPVPEA